MPSSYKIKMQYTIARKKSTRKFPYNFKIINLMSMDTFKFSLTLYHLSLTHFSPVSHFYTP